LNYKRTNVWIEHQFARVNLIACRAVGQWLLYVGYGLSPPAIISLVKTHTFV